MRYLFGSLPQPNGIRLLNEWLHFNYALTEAPHTTKQLWKVTRFIAGMRAINDAIKVDDTPFSPVGDYVLDELIEAVPKTAIPAIMNPRRFDDMKQTGSKNRRKRVKAHYEAEYARCMGMRVKRLHYEGLLTIHTVYGAALYLEEFITVRMNEYTNQPGKPDHTRALSSAVAFYHSAKKAAAEKQWPIKLPAFKRVAVYKENVNKARKVLKQKRTLFRRESIKAIKQALPECVKPNGKYDVKAICEYTGLSRRTVYRYLKAMK